MYLRIRNSLGIALVLVCCVACQPEASKPEVVDTRSEIHDDLQNLLEESVAARGFERGVALHVDSPLLGIDWEGATGFADPQTKEVMTPEHPVRIASNTKTYIAAAVLRLWEEEQVDLDAAIMTYLPDEFLAILKSDDYDPAKITVRHLLTHTSGMYDHGASDRYSEMIVANPNHRWSRTEQLQICVDDGDRLGEPGEFYSYSDTGYILLGEIVESVTGQSLADGVWSVIDRESLGLAETWFESLEPQPAGALNRAHQFFGDIDVTGFDPSFDLWGGGGIATSVGDLALFTRSLFDGRVFADSATLETMLTTFDGVQAAPNASPRSLPPGAYRMGLWVLDFNDYAMYRHSGFWCTSATYVPELDLVVTGTANQHEAGEMFDEIIEKTLKLLTELQQ